MSVAAIIIATIQTLKWGVETGAHFLASVLIMHNYIQRALHLGVTLESIHIFINFGKEQMMLLTQEDNLH